MPASAAGQLPRKRVVSPPSPTRFSTCKRWPEPFRRSAPGAEAVRWSHVGHIVEWRSRLSGSRSPTWSLPRDRPTLKSWIHDIEATFTQATARTCRPYWRLAARLLGDRRLAVLTTATWPSPHALWGVGPEDPRDQRTIGDGHICVDPAALTKPRRARSRPRALDDNEVGAAGWRGKGMTRASVGSAPTAAVPAEA